MSSIIYPRVFIAFTSILEYSTFIMNMFIVLFASLALTAAAPSEDILKSRAARAQELTAIRRLPALEREEVHDAFGQYALRYVTAEGIVVCERGRLVPNIKGDDYVLIIEGEISYIGEDGKEYVTKFTAGIDGNHVEGNDLPVPPVPISPEAEVSTGHSKAISEAFPAGIPINE